jgi:hypothetical protein
MIPQEPFEFEVEIFAQDATAEDIDQMSRQLLAELRDMDIESASLSKGGHAPLGTKSADPVTIGALAVVVLPTLLPKIVESVQAWALRGQGRTVKFKGKVGGQMIEFEGHTQDLEKLISTLTKGKKN